MKWGNVIENCRRLYPYYIVAEEITTWSSAVMWKSEHVPNEFSDVTKEISKQVEGIDS